MSDDEERSGDGLPRMRGWVRWALVAWIALQVGLSLEFLVRDRSLPTLAVLDHYQRALHIYRDLRQDSAASALAQLELVAIGAAGYRPPLLFAIAQPGMSLLGPSMQAAAWANPIWHGALLLATFVLARRLTDGDDVAGLLASLSLGAAPALVGHRGLFLPFMPLACCAAMMAAGLAGDHLRATRWRSAWIGAAAGLGLLLRWDFAVWAVALGIGHLLRAPVADRWPRFRRLLGSVVVCCLVAGWWYALSFSKTIRLYLKEGIITTAHRNEGFVELFSWGNVLYYPVRLHTLMMGPMAALALLALVWLLRRRQSAAWMLVAWLLLVWPFYLIVPMKSARYTLPALPALACALAIAARQLGRRPGTALGVVALLQLTLLLWVPGGERIWPEIGNTVASRGYHFPSWERIQDSGQLRAHTATIWADAHSTVHRLIREHGAGNALLLCELPDSGYFAPLKGDARSGHVMPSLVQLQQEPPRIRAVLAYYPYLLISGPGLPAPGVASDIPLPRDPEVARRMRVLRTLVEAEARRRKLLARIPLPDGSEGRLYGPR